MSGIQGQISLLNRLIVTKQQQEQEQIPESPSPSPAPSASNQRGTLSRSRHSSISHTSATTPLDEERSHELSLNIEDVTFRGNYGNLNNIENNNSQSTCVIS